MRFFLALFASVLPLALHAEVMVSRSEMLSAQIDLSQFDADEELVVCKFERGHRDIRLVSWTNDEGQHLLSDLDQEILLEAPLLSPSSQDVGGDQTAVIGFVGIDGGTEYTIFTESGESWVDRRSFNHHYNALLRITDLNIELFELFADAQDITKFYNGSCDQVFWKDVPENLELSEEGYEKYITANDLEGLFDYLEYLEIRCDFAENEDDRVIVLGQVLGDGMKLTITEGQLWETNEPLPLVEAESGVNGWGTFFTHQEGELRYELWGQNSKDESTFNAWLNVTKFGDDNETGARAGTLRSEMGTCEISLALPKEHKNDK